MFAAKGKLGVGLGLSLLYYGMRQIIKILDSQVESRSRGINRVILRNGFHHKHEGDRLALNAWGRMGKSGRLPGIGLAVFVLWDWFFLWY